MGACPRETGLARRIGVEFISYLVWFVCFLCVFRIEPVTPYADTGGGHLLLVSVHIPGGGGEGGHQ